MQQSLFCLYKKRKQIKAVGFSVQPASSKVSFIVQAKANGKDQKRIDHGQGQISVVRIFPGRHLEQAELQGKRRTEDAKRENLSLSTKTGYSLTAPSSHNQDTFCIKCSLGTLLPLIHISAAQGVEDAQATH